MKTAEYYYKKYKRFVTAVTKEEFIAVVNSMLYNAKQTGYAEAMRWRNPKEESPPVGAYVQLKAFGTFHNRQIYAHDEYLGNNKWRFCESEYIDIIGWRPIE